MIYKNIYVINIHNYVKFWEIFFFFCFEEIETVNLVQN